MQKVGELYFVAGKVSKIEEGKGNAAGALIVVHVDATGYDAAQGKSCMITYKCEFWNKIDTKDASKNKMRADRVRQKNLKEGSYVVVEGFLDNKDDTKLNGITIGYNNTTIVVQRQEDKAPCVIYFGYVGFAEERENKNGQAIRASFRTRELGYENEHWTGVTFQNQQFGDGSTTNLFERAKKVLYKGNLVLMKCSEIKPYSSKDKTYYSAFGQSFEVVKFADRKSNSDNTSAPAKETPKTAPAKEKPVAMAEPDIMEEPDIDTEELPFK